MSTPTAKDLLAQADRLMRQRTPEELPVLTDLVIEEIELTSLSDRMDEVIPTSARPAWMPAVPAAAKAALPSPVPPAAAPASVVTPARTSVAAAATPTPPGPAVVPSAVAVPQPVAELFARRPRMSHDSHAGPVSATGPDTQTASVNFREQFNEQLLAKLEELQHSVFSQVMQKLELHAAGALKSHLRETLEPALIGIARDLAEQVAEDTSAQVRTVVSDAVDAEIARLREQLSKKRS